VIKINTELKIPRPHYPLYIYVRVNKMNCVMTWSLSIVSLSGGNVTLWWLLLMILTLWCCYEWGEKVDNQKIVLFGGLWTRNVPIKHWPRGVYVSLLQKYSVPYRQYISAESVYYNTMCSDHCVQETCKPWSVIFLYMWSLFTWWIILGSNGDSCVIGLSLSDP
jgi:hypothetical protein